jgi:hypothetical protein
LRRRDKNIGLRNDIPVHDQSLANAAALLKHVIANHLRELLRRFQKQFQYITYESIFWKTIIVTHRMQL